MCLCLATISTAVSRDSGSESLSTIQILSAAFVTGIWLYQFEAIYTYWRVFFVDLPVAPSPTIMTGLTLLVLIGGVVAVSRVVSRRH